MMKRGKRKNPNLKLNRWYLDEGDVAQHVACFFLLEYGNGSKPICNQACTHNCQHYLRYQIDILWEEMTEWRGEHGDSMLEGGYVTTLYLGENLMLMKMETWNYKRTSTSYFHNFLFFKATKHSVESLGEEITNEFPATKHRPADDWKPLPATWET